MNKIQIFILENKIVGVKWIKEHEEVNDAFYNPLSEGYNEVHELELPEQVCKDIFFALYYRISKSNFIRGV